MYNFFGISILCRKGICTSRKIKMYTSEDLENLYTTLDVLLVDVILCDKLKQGSWFQISSYPLYWKERRSVHSDQHLYLLEWLVFMDNLYCLWNSTVHGVGTTKLSFICPWQKLPILRFLTSPSTSCCIVPPKIALSKGWPWLFVSWIFAKAVGRIASITWETVADISCVVVAHTVDVDIVVSDDVWSGMEITTSSLSLLWNENNF